MISRTLSRLPPDSLAGSLLRLPLRMLPRNLVVRVRGGLNRGMRWIAGSNVHGCWLGHYESDKQEAIRELVRPGMTAFDVGANAGFYTLAFSRLVGPTGHVWAFEPFPENAANLLRHLRLNSISNATLLQAAIADRIGVTGFEAGTSNSGGKLGSRVGGHVVITASLDELVDCHGLPMPDIVKVDVEGAEADVLCGAARILARRNTTFLLALHGDKPMRDCLAILETAGYRARRLDGEAVTSTSPFVDEIVAEARPL